MKNLIYLFLALLIFACTTDDNNNVDDTQVEWLYVHTAIEANATNSNTLVIPFTEDIFAFTDRPNREHKYISGDEFASYWNDYDDENSFKLDPPNAVLTWVDADGVEEVEVVITDADFDGNNVIYTIENTTITANQSFEEVSLFVDGNGSSNNVYLASNGVTVKASAGAVAGDTGTIDGFTFAIVDNNGLSWGINNGEELNNVCTSLVTDMVNLFKNKSNFNQNIRSWDVSSVTNMGSMFDGANSFNQPIGDWDVSNVISMKQMFEGATLFNQPIGSWDVSNVTDMSGMFYYLQTFNQDISSWDVSNVTNMNSMFDGATAFDQDISNWDVSSVTDMSSMFRSAFNQPIGNWDVSSVTTMGGMFGSNAAFNQPIGSWDVSNVTDMEYMFQSATSFNQDISSWSVDNVTNCDNFNDGAPLTEANTPNFTNCTP
jgi:surface protein